MGKQQKWSTVAAAAAQNATASSPALSEPTGNQVSEAAPQPSPPKRVQQPEQKLAPQGPPTIDPIAEYEKAQFELDQALAGEPQKEQKQGDKTTPKATPAKETAEVPDPLDKEIDEHEAAMAKAKLTPAKAEEEPEPEPAKGEEEEPDSELEVPEDDGAAYAKWINSLSVPAQKRITQQQKQIKDLKALASDRIMVNPTLSDPLSDVTNAQQLEAAKAHWETVSHGIDKLNDALKDDEFTPLTIKLANGKEHTFQSKEELEESKVFARAALYAVPDKKSFLVERDQVKPWETGTKLAPGLTEKDSWENTEAVKFLKVNPSFKRLPDWEIKLGHMIRSMKQEKDEKDGKARHVRLELDAEGNVKTPKRVVVQKAPAPKAKTAPSLNRPAVSSGGKEEAQRDALARLEASGGMDEAALLDAVRAL